MLFTTRSISDLLYGSNRMLSLSTRDDVIHTALLADNFTDERIDALKTTWETANSKTESHKAAIDTHKEKRLTFENTWHESNASYMTHINMAKYICMDNPESMTKFGLNKPRAKKFNTWLLQASDFYSRVLADPDILAAFDEKFGETVTDIEAGKQGILNTNIAKEDQNKAIGEAQSQREDRDRILRKLYIDIRGFLVVLKRAMKDNLQHLEKVGILVYSPGYRKKKKEEETPTEPIEPTAPTEPTDPASQAAAPNPGQ